MDQPEDQHVDQLRIDIVRGRLSTHGFAQRTRPLDDGTEVRLVPLEQTGSSTAELYTHLLATTTHPVAFLEAVEPVGSDDSAVARVHLDANGRVLAGPRPSPMLTVHTPWEDQPQSFRVDARIPVSTVLLERALRIRGAEITRTDRNVLVGSAPDGTPLLVKDARSHLNGMPAVHAAERKDIARALLSRTGVAVPAGVSFDRAADPAEALELLERLGSLVVKPVDGDKGRGVTVGVTDPDGLREAWDLALHETRAGVLVEEVRTGEEVRVLVIDGRARAAAQRVPPHVTGDGERTIRDLVNAKNSRRQESFFLRGKPVSLTPHRLRLLGQSGLTPLSVPAEGQRCDLDRTGNVRTGAEPVDVTESIAPSYLRIAERAVAAVPGLRVAGVDLMGTDLATPAADDGHVVIELNPNPGLGIHAGAQGGESLDVAGALAAAILDVRPPATTSPLPRPRDNVRFDRDSIGATASESSSHALLARAFASRGFTIDPLADDTFFAQRGNHVHGVWDALTDHSAHAAVFALQNPNTVSELLEHAGVPLLEGRAFTRFDRRTAQELAAQWGHVAIHGGTHRPLVVDAASEDAFTAAWEEAAGHATMPGMRVTRAATAPCLRVLVAHGTVVAVREESQGGTVTATEAPGVAQSAETTETSPLPDPDDDPADRPELRTARAAVAALPGLDIAEVVVAPVLAAPAVVHMRTNPDLAAFGDGSTRSTADIAARIVALHLDGAPG
ncbi:hypothetical protein [Brevibacterium yomogidense]|uniref:Cyanophycin synthase n=1 Tax=Brevibacterium yomogidense TaxID=946573 RepID=A0A1X6X7P0_9MICO|nr:hypothetical protein [Brevibacterium yomogidense]SLM95140.1 Cyanophycin synthase [Brevibacterium yomogidense]